MNLRHLGDVLDHWKGSLFRYLQARGSLHDLAVDPMATDRERWSEEDVSLFAGLLGVERKQIIPHEVSLFGLPSRDRYFEEIRHRGDIFLDPDTGIATGVSLSAKHVRPIEVTNLLDSDNQRVVAVYQHISRQKTCARVDSCVAALGGDIDTEWCSYESHPVAMLFFSQDRSRIQDVTASLRELLGRHADRRVRFGKAHKTA